MSRPDPISALLWLALILVMLFTPGCDMKDDGLMAGVIGFLAGFAACGVWMSIRMILSFRNQWGSWPWQ